MSYARKGVRLLIGHGGFWEHTLRDEADLNRHRDTLITTRSNMGW